MTHSGGKPHTNVGDRGQRYEITYYDPHTKTRKVFGWSTDLDGARAFAGSIDLHPSMEFPQIKDRETGEAVVP